MPKAGLRLCSKPWPPDCPSLIRACPRMPTSSATAAPAFFATLSRTTTRPSSRCRTNRAIVVAAKRRGSGPRAKSAPGTTARSVTSVCIPACWIPVMADSILVLGGNGFIGHALSQALAQCGTPVIAVGRHSPASAHAGIETIVAAPNTSEEFLPLLARSRAVVHAASTSTPGSSAGNPLAEVGGNLQTSLALLQALQSFPDRPLLYFSSGGTLYGDVQA